MTHPIEAITNKVNECIALAEQKYNIQMPKVDIKFNLRGRAAGQAVYEAWCGKLTVRFNKQHIQAGGQTLAHLIDLVVPHEVAHAVCFAYPTLGKNHDAGWKRVCKALGGNGQRCYSESDAPEAVALNRPYVYITTDGHEVRITRVMHNKIQAGVQYRVKGKGLLARECQYNYSATVAPSKVEQPKAKAKAQPKAKAKAKGTQSKADVIRGLIAQGKSLEEVVLFAIVNLGMSKTLARTYYKNNVAKV